MDNTPQHKETVAPQSPSLSMPPAGNLQDLLEELRRDIMGEIKELQLAQLSQMQLIAAQVVEPVQELKIQYEVLAHNLLDISNTLKVYVEAPLGELKQEFEHPSQPVMSKQFCHCQEHAAPLPDPSEKQEELPPELPEKDAGG